MDARSSQFSIPPFNDSLPTQDLRREWEEWHRSFELVLELRNIESQHEKFVFLLACGGRGLQKVFYNAGPAADEIYPPPVKVPLMPDEIPEYDNAIKRLQKFFVGKRNERIEVELFRSMTQSQDEAFSQFILRLRSQAARCDFADKEEREILHQVTMGASDEKVRDKGLENVMGLDELMNYAVNREILHRQKTKPKIGDELETVAAVRQSQWKRPRTTSSFKSGPFRNNECGDCGRTNHAAGSDICSAKKATCRRCGAQGHFARKCPGMFGREQRTSRYGFQRRPQFRDRRQQSNTHRNEMETNALQGAGKWIEDLPSRPSVKEDSLKVE